ncbi:hypothetical protein MMC16_007831 [Acarospora aff. strigata]|nr:hypothetical protein [Acarospora aff. strigata]
MAHAPVASVFLVVNWYKPDTVVLDVRCSNALLVKAGPDESPVCSMSIISAEKAEKQVFYAKVQQSICHGDPWLWILHYPSLNFVAASHLLQESNELILFLKWATSSHKVGSGVMRSLKEYRQGG